MSETPGCATAAPATQTAADAAFVEAFRAGDTRAFEELYRRCQPEVVRRLRRRCGDTGVAEDLAQEAFLRAASSIHSPGADYFRPWVHRIAANLCVDHFRSQRRRPRCTTLSAQVEMVIPDHVVDTEEEVARNESARQVWRSLGRLSPRHRAVILLREIEGLDYRSIATELGLSVSAVETLLFRARARLRSQLAAAA